MATAHEAVTAVAGLVDSRSDTAVSPATTFRIGSIAKVYTATLVVQAAADAGLSLDAPVVTVLPGFRFGDDHARDAVTIWHLLNHAAGIDGDFWDGFGVSDDAIDAYVAHCAEVGSLFPSGTSWSYSNSG